MLMQLKQYLTGLDQYLNNSYRLAILRQATALIETGIEIHKLKNGISYNWILIFQ